MCIIRKKQYKLCCIFHTSLKSEKNGVIKRVIKTILIKFRRVLLRKTSFCVSGYCKPEILLFLLNVSFNLGSKMEKHMEVSPPKFQFSSVQFSCSVVSDSL